MNDLFGPAPADAVFDDMVDKRRAVHRRPELPFAEHETTALIRDHMASLGIEEALRVTETGGIFSMEGGRPGRSVVLRGDIDGLPVQEDQARAVHSEVEGLMHACGHDVHVAALLGAASLLAARREDLPGRYVFLFQPAEEALCGAKSMLEGGALTAMEGSSPRRLPCDLAGAIGLRRPAGRHRHVGGELAPHHAERPRRSRRHALGAGRCHPGHGRVGEPAGRRDRRVLSYEGTDCVCSAGTIHAGTAVNVVPTSARITGTLRTFTESQHQQALARLQELCDNVGDDQGVHVELEVPEHTRAVVNDPEATDLVEREAGAVVGPNLVFRMPPVPPSDDVSEFLRHLPGCYFFIGGGAADGSSGMHHSPSFVVEDESLRVGTSVLVRSALALAAP